MVDEIVVVGATTIKRKRVASSQFLAETVKLQKRKKDWAQILNLNSQIKKRNTTYIEEWGDLAAPTELVDDPSLDLEQS